MDVVSAAPPRTTSQAKAPSVRRYELDWLRTGAVFGLIPFHVAVVFTTGGYDYVKNAQTSTQMDFLVSFVSAWGIPLLFLVAGGSARYALAARSVKRYLNERVTRLLIPFIFGMLLIVPLQVYIGRLSRPNPPSFPVAYGQFLWSLALIFTGKIPSHPDWIGHLWFIPPLMAFAALAIPYAWLLRTARGRAMVEWLAGGIRGYSPLLLLGLPLGVVFWLALESGRGLPPAIASFITNASGTLVYLIFFLYGFLLYLDNRFLASVRRDTWIALALGVGVWLGMRYGAAELGGAFLNAWWARIVFGVLRGYSGWWLVMAILGLAIRFLQFTNPTERYLARAAYPVYIIHMPILSLIAFYVVRLDLDIALKFFTITIFSLLVALAIYDGLIRRIGVLRMLFGLREEPQVNAPPTPRPPAMPQRPSPAPRHHLAAAPDARQSS